MSQILFSCLECGDKFDPEDSDAVRDENFCSESCELERDEFWGSSHDQPEGPEYNDEDEPW